jgi:hypothetical protein
MIDRCSNKVAITSQYRSQPMDKWEDYPITVLDMAPLIMVMLPTVSSFFSTCGCFLRVGRSSSGDLPPLSLACGWPLGANGSLSCEWRRLHELRVENPSGARKGGAELTLGLGQASRLGPIGPGPSRPGSVAPSFLWVLMHLCTLPLYLHYFDDVILASKMEVFLAWSPVFYASILGVVPL